MFVDMKQITVADFAKQRGVAPATVYTWIDRDQASRNQFKVHRYGRLLLIEDKQRNPKKK